MRLLPIDSQAIVPIRYPPPSHMTRQSPSYGGDVVINLTPHEHHPFSEVQNPRTQKYMWLLFITSCYRGSNTEYDNHNQCSISPEGQGVSKTTKKRINNVFFNLESIYI